MFFLGSLPNYNARSQTIVPDPAASYQQYQLRYINTHTHTKCSDAIQPGNAVEEIIRANYKHFDGLFLTDHGEHLNEQEWRSQQAAARIYTRANKVCLRAHEVTGTNELTTFSSKDPAYQHGWGHIVVVNTDTYTGRRSIGNGRPPIIVSTYTEFLNWLESTPNGMGIFAHPSLYMTEESFNGFIVPPNNRAIEQLVGCELSSHGLEYAGLGNGTELRSSNEACFRELLRKGWHIGAYMSGDEHVPPYGTTNTVTGMYLIETTEHGVLEAMGARRTFATEEPGASITLIAQSGSSTSIMGETLGCTDGDNVFHVRCKTTIGTVERLSLVFVSTKGSFYDHDIHSQQFNRSDEHWGMLVSKADLLDKAIVCVYAKAKLRNGHNLLSSPIWLQTR